MKKLLITLCTVAAMMIPTVAFADGQVEKAGSAEEYAKMSSVDIGEDIVKELDKETGEVDGEDFEAVFGEEFPGEKRETENIIENEDFVIVDETKDSYMVAPEFVTGRILVGKELNNLNGAESGVSYEGTTVLNYDSEESAKEGYENLVEKYGEENVLVDAPIIMSDAQGWGTEYMELDKKANAIRASENARTVKVAVVDSGISKTHKIFEGKTVTSDSINLCSVGASEDYADDTGHGTAVAGIIAESTPENVEIMVVKTGSTLCVGSIATGMQGIQYAVENGADVINCSWGGLTKEAGRKIYDKTLKKAYEKGVIVIASAGNKGLDLDTYELYHYPSESPYVIEVGSISISGERADFSNYGSNLDFVAPGKRIKVADYKQDNAVRYGRGTSYSAPLVSAAAALIKSEKETDCNSTYEELKRCSVDLGPAGKDPEYGWGMPKFSEGIVTPPTGENTDNEYREEESEEKEAVSPEDSDENIKLSYYTTTYNGKRKKPTVTIDGLIEEIDYIVRYEKNKDAGTARVIIERTGYRYCGEKIIPFKIKRKAITPRITLKRTSGKPKVKVYDGKKLIEKSNYKVSYSKRNGAYNVTVKMKKNYKGVAKKTIAIK